MTIHIYGDSFAADHGQYDYNPKSKTVDDTTYHAIHENTWPGVLSKLKKEKIKDYAQGGSGPNWSLKNLLAHLENDKIKNYDTIVFLLSDQKRLQFPFLKDDGHSGGVFRLAENPNVSYDENKIRQQRIKEDRHRLRFSEIRVPKKSNWKHPYQPGHKDYSEEDGLGNQSYLNEHIPVVKTIAQSLGSMFLYENVKNITFLHLLSQQFKKFRFLVFTCFSLSHYLQYYENFDYPSTKILHDLDFSYLNNDNFDYYNMPIGHMVGNEDQQGGDVHKANHMTIEQNRKFGKFVYDLLMYNEPDTSWFSKTDPYDDVVEYDRPIEPVFIYE